MSEPEPKKQRKDEPPARLLKQKLDKLNEVSRRGSLANAKPHIAKFLGVLRRHQSADTFTGNSDILCRIGDITGRLIDFDFMTKQGAESANAVGFYTLPLVHFGAILGAVEVIEKERLEQKELEMYWLTRMEAALAMYDLRMREYRARKRQVRKDARLEERARYLSIIDFLRSMNKIELTEPLEELTMGQLKDICAPFSSDVTRVLNLNDLHKRRCDTCINELSDSTETGPDPTPDNTAIPDIPGLFCKGPVSPEDILKHQCTWITSGTTIGLVEDPDTNQSIIAMFVSFPTLDEMSTESLCNWQELAHLLHQGYLYGTPCTSNGAHQAAGGCQMIVLGWRHAYDKVPYAPYAAQDKFKHGAERRPEFVEFQKQTYRIVEIIEAEFGKTLVKGILELAQDYVAENGLPPLGALSTDPATWKSSPGCNFTITRHSEKTCKGFANQMHRDNDAFEYVFSIYLFVDKNGNLVTDPDRIRKCMKGGLFAWGDSHVVINPQAICWGVVMFMWRGTHERHCTVTSEHLDQDTIRIGTSIQVNERLREYAAKYQESQKAYEQGRRKTKPVQPKGLRM
ncbi:hypothetical protein FRC09_018721 [Ceratobasidium sp. 395]|nr:hypothetical protein FRC09_018721 [Ceratobasidium sp. 395]